jgi:hypothetical protein
MVVPKDERHKISLSTYDSYTTWSFFLLPNFPLHLASHILHWAGVYMRFSSRDRGFPYFCSIAEAYFFATVLYGDAPVGRA